MLGEKISNWIMVWVASSGSRKKVLREHLSKDTLRFRLISKVSPGYGQKESGWWRVESKKG